MYLVGVYEYYIGDDKGPEVTIMIDDGELNLNNSDKFVINTNKFATIIDESYNDKYTVKENKMDYTDEEILDVFSQFKSKNRMSEYFTEKTQLLFNSYKERKPFNPGDELILVKNSFPKEFTKITLNGEVNNFSQKTFGINYNITFNKDYELSLVSSCYTTEGVISESKVLTPDEVSKIMI